MPCFLLPAGGEKVAEGRMRGKFFLSAVLPLIPSLRSDLLPVLRGEGVTRNCLPFPRLELVEGAGRRGNPDLALTDRNEAGIAASCRRVDRDHLFLRETEEIGRATGFEACA